MGALIKRPFIKNIERQNDMKGKLIVIEGVDSSGKATQSELLFKEVSKKYDTKLITFPDYKSDFSLPVRNYLRGDLGKNPEDVNAYAASSFYAIDRYASYKTKWGDFFENGGVIIADRYTTSNIVHQASKIKGDKKEFIDWLTDYEYNKLSLPVPDLVIFLDMPPESAEFLMRERKNKITGEAQKDIHESDGDFLRKSYNNAVSVAEICSWHRIVCAKGNSIRSIEDIHNEILNKVKEILD